MKKTYIIFGLLGFVLGGGSAAGQSLDSEIAHLIETHPELASARNKVSESEEAINRRLADYFPTVNFRADYGRAVTDTPNLRNADQSPFAGDARLAELTVTQNLFKGFRSSARYERAIITRDLAGLALDSKQQTLIFDAISIYIDVIRRKKLLDLASKNEKIIQQQLFLEDARVERGSGVAVDVLFAKARLQIASERRLVFEGEYLNALATYRKLFGRPAQVEQMKVMVLPENLTPDTLEEARSTALNEHPDLLDSERNIGLSKEGIRLSQAPFYPQIDLIGRGRIESDFDGVAGTRRDTSVMLRFNWDLFSGLSTRAESAAAKYRHDAARNERDDVRRQVVEDLQLAWDRLNTAKARAELLKNAVNIASEVHVARVRLSESGKETIINVLDAQSEVFSAEGEAVDAEFDSYITQYRLLWAMGRLRPDVFAANN